MSHDRDPLRLTDPASESSDGLRALLRSARDEAPSPAQSEQLAARLGALFETPPGAPVALPGAARVSAGRKWLWWLLGTIGVAVALWLAWPRTAPRLEVAQHPAARAPRSEPSRTEPRAEAPPTAAAAHAPAEHAPAPPRWPAQQETPSVSALPSAARPARPRALSPPVDTPRSSTRGAHAIADAGAVATSPAVVAERAEAPVTRSTEGEDEWSLIDRAEQALRQRDYARALALSAEHERAFARGEYIEERERIAIEALAHTNDQGAARARAERFRRAHPRSPQWRRIEVLLGGEGNGSAHSE